MDQQVDLLDRDTNSVLYVTVYINYKMVSHMTIQTA